MDSKKPGRRGTAPGRRLTEERRQFLALVHEGVSVKEASRIVGINRRTGQHWLNGRHAHRSRGATPPIAKPALPGPSRYLCEADRVHIADQLLANVSIRQIAAELNRSPSTVSREIRRNRHPESGQYRPHAAQARAEARRPRPKLGKIAACLELRRLVQCHLDTRWSPEQIAQSLRARFPDRPDLHVTHETIYQAIYRQDRGGLTRELPSRLRTGRVRRKPRRQAQQRQPRFQTPLVPLSRRPTEADDRTVPGHWEGDLIIGKDSASAIGTLVERSTRYTVLVHLPEGRSTDLVRDALVETANVLPPPLKRSLTWDQGSEMGRHHEFTRATGMPVYFCEPASPWQRGTNENTNGLLRQYFPKGTDLSVHTREHLAAVAAELNARPRKTLGWETPAERLSKLLPTPS